MQKRLINFDVIQQNFSNSVFFPNFSKCDRVDWCFWDIVPSNPMCVSVSVCLFIFFAPFFTFIINFCVCYYIPIGFYFATHLNH